MAWGSVDDYQLVIERVTTLATHPALHHFSQTLGCGEPSEAAIAYRDVSQIVSETLEVVIANHVATAAPIALEGDTLVPALATQRCFVGVPANGRVRAVFLVEPDEMVIAQQMLARRRGALNEVQLTWRAQFSSHYSQWLQHEARPHGFPVIAPRRYESLVERILNTLHRVCHHHDPAFACGDMV